MKTNSHERSLVLLKPDAVQRGLMGEIMTRFERKGLKIVAMKMVWPTLDMAKRHYDQPESAMITLGERTIAAYAEKGIEDKRTPVEIARDIQKKLQKYLVTGPIVALVIEGAHAIAHVRKLRGHTNPLAADIGTITADYTIDSYFISDDVGRSIRNLVHASGTVDEAETEIKIWFTEDEIFEYELAIEKILYDPQWDEIREDLTTKK